MRAGGAAPGTILWLTKQRGGILPPLHREDLYGYMLTQNMQSVANLSESTLYPILKRLEANGYVTTDTQEHGGRIRRYFYITDAGQERIDAFLDEWDEVKRIYAFIKGEEV